MIRALDASRRPRLLISGPRGPLSRLLPVLSSVSGVRLVSGRLVSGRLESGRLVSGKLVSDRLVSVPFHAAVRLTYRYTCTSF